jgi:hypothetical protein
MNDSEGDLHIAGSNPTGPVTIKRCIKCRERKPESDYSKNPSKKDGLNSICRKCFSMYYKSWYSKNSTTHKINTQNRTKTYRQDFRTFLDSVKDVPCKDCGVKYPPYVMDFDHRDPSEKLMGVGDTYRYASSVISDEVKEEIKKCDIVCSNCHRERTHSRSQILKVSENNQEISKKTGLYKYEA